MATFEGSVAAFGRSLRPQAVGVGARLRRLLALWAARRAERIALAEMDERMLRDIGIDRLTALREADRPFWSGSARSRVRHWP